MTARPGRPTVLALLSGRSSETVIVLDRPHGAQRWAVMYQTAFGDGYV